MPRLLSAMLALAIGCAALAVSPDAAGWPGLSVAWADDDDDGGDDGGGSSSFDGGRDGAGFGPARRIPRPARAAPPPEALPEIVAPDLLESELVQLLAEGFGLLERIDLPSVPAVLWRLAPPPGLAPEAARDRVRALPGGVAADLNHLYRPGQAATPAAQTQAPCRHANCGSRLLVDWPDQARRAAGCAAPVPVGVIDTAVNPAHALLDGAALEVVRLGELAGSSSAGHGTAVVSALLGQPGSRIEGLLPEVQVLAVDIFTRAGGDERADTVALLRGLDLIAGRGLRVANLSLSGPGNAALAAVLDRLAAGGLVVVAAAGNGGPQAPPAWPAAHPAVIAVTAVDGRGRVYRQAQRGDHIDLAAPGVGLMLAASVSGARERSGTSFAVPFVSAAAALILGAEPELPVAAVGARLRALTRDAGAEGPDPVFGAGILDAGGLCR